ncbi:phosphoadenosine phosphosulfate reductase domain-containing protein [Sphingopyxis sp. FD7]|uniref:phosphoadenosine phosphosulfate reductase domain-containing protein n=1 Tax=Sphingopyxis sp. FD7 TaxID=1914525 RepID=UPI000DC629B7|nr:phosphoadenosine phosphosulfate reductase family protein [Sphingopyxis sp. FD7]BBB14332.1 hypothetical protein SPYCA_3590 [Sphingopyxis sp. FD7]
MSNFEPPIALDPEVTSALRQGAHVIFSLSGGKDSSAAAFAVNAHLDMIGHPRDRRHAIHADLGIIEWLSTPAMVERIAAMLAVELTVVRRKAGGLIERWEQRWASSLRRYENLETYQLVSPFSSARLRFCTGETKVQPIGSFLRASLAGETVISVVGIRREESLSRAAAPVSKRDTRFAPEGNRAGTRMLTWHPIVDWSAKQVFAYHAAHAIPLHEAYDRGADRLSCSYCVLAGLNNLMVSAQCEGNHPAYRSIVGIEINSGFSFQPGRWLGDIRPEILGSDQRRGLAAAKRLAVERRTLESRLPADLRFTKGWPPRIPAHDEAETICSVRGTLTSRLRIANRWPTARAVRERFAELHAAKAA